MILKVNQITKKIGNTIIVENISFSVKKGEIFGLLGPNGAGKTTIIRMLVGLSKPTKGTIHIEDFNIEKERSKAIRAVGAIVENPEFYPYLSGYQNLQQYGRLSGITSRSKILEVVERAGLSASINEKVANYSLGMKQRLGIAQALLGDPKLLILDEPTNGLDPAGIHELRHFLRAISAKGASILVSSHLLSEVEQICDTVGIINKGQWVTASPIHDLKKKFKSSRLLVNTGNNEKAIALFKKAGINSELVTENGQTFVAITHTSGHTAPLLNILIEADIEVESLIPELFTLEQIFLQLTTSRHE